VALIDESRLIRREEKALREEQKARSTEEICRSAYILSRWRRILVSFVAVGVKSRLASGAWACVHLPVLLEGKVKWGEKAGLACLLQGVEV
jgi:hypothetical protein